MSAIAFDYPPQRAGRHFPGDPMLLDTCLLQHMKYVMDAGDGDHMSDEAEAALLRKCGPRLGPELAVLSDLMVFFAETNPPAWVVAEASLIEFERVSGAKGAELRQWWYEW